MSNIESSFKNNPRNFWKFVNKSNHSNNIPKELSYNGVTSSNEQETAELFSSYFSSVYSSNNFAIDTEKLGLTTNDLPNNINFSVDEVCEYLITMRGNWSVGSNGLCGEFIYQLR